MDPLRSTPQACLVADVGGTNARLGWTRDGRDVQQVVSYRCADFVSLADILLHYADAVAAQHAGLRLRDAVVAIAGYLDQDRLVNANLPWDVSVALTTEAAGLGSLALINDFGAVAHAIPGVPRHALVSLAPPRQDQGLQVPALVLGPGTGLGAALCLDQTGAAVLLSEAGHAALAANNEKECDVLSILSKRWQHVDSERVLSGPGLMNLAEALCGLAGESPCYERPEQVVSAARAGDAIAQETLEIFCGWLGSQVANLALTLGARDVYLAGGVTTHIAPFLHAGHFHQRYAETFIAGRVPPPVWRIEHGQLGLVGAASYWRAHRGLRSKTDVKDGA